MDDAALIDLAHWVRDTRDLPIFSILISRHDTLVFELYTGGIGRQDAHYVMSVTKSVLSSLVGAALTSGAIHSLDAPVSDLLPRAVFASDSDVARFRAIHLREVMGMSALKVSDLPRDTTAAATQHQNEFLGAANRVAFALREPLLSSPGNGSFLYNDETPSLAAGVVQYATGKRLFDFGRVALFDPMGFANEEWMHEDATGIDLGGYGFRMRPVDMQKLGQLYLHRGNWHGAQLVPADWVDSTFTPYIRRSASTRPYDNYGWFWWTFDYGAGWRFLVADGWRGQRIAVNRDHDLVVTMTAYIELQDEAAIFERVLAQYVMPSVTKGSTGDHQPALDAALDEIRATGSRVKANAESRMIPSSLPKGQSVPFRP